MKIMGVLFVKYRKGCVYIDFFTYVITLGILAFITDYVKEDMATLFPSNTENTVQM
ncbi:UNVERIFIED_ORG: hypothetical protein ABIC97_004966 [Peribacillus simplex]